MLGHTLRLDDAEEPWAGSSARPLIATEHEGAILTVAVACRIEDHPVEIEALLDTGATWSIIGGPLARVMEARLGTSGHAMILSTRFGRIHGVLHELEVVLVAERGESISLSATMLVAPGWTGPVVLGYQGFLERIRFALDPGVADDDAWFFFAHAG